VTSKTRGPSVQPGHYRTSRTRQENNPAKTPARKQRLDQLMFARGLAESRAKAQALIMAGTVFAGTKRLDKPGLMLGPDTPIEIHGPAHPWVSRGGVKLSFALEQFAISPEGKICLDLGASTGGFTDVLLQRGAAKVYAVDVGKGQLAEKLRKDPRVVVLEKTNARYLSRAQVPEPVDLIVCDASFIGLRTLLPAPLSLAAAKALLVALIKPQFEAGPKRVIKGVVRDPAVHRQVCASIRDWLEAQAGWRVIGICPSPILGPKGNAEFLIAAEYQCAG
jgi:23S rRNA (cytidine1920-2'-O)/16S rRNA (cytidine1409-2'-O)-methyltransferase